MEKTALERTAAALETAATLARRAANAARAACPPPPPTPRELGRYARQDLMEMSKMVVKLHRTASLEGATPDLAYAVEMIRETLDTLEETEGAR